MPNVSSFGAQTDNSVVQGTVTDRAMVIPDIPPQGLMSVGPRVTPHFVKPSLWSALTTYHFFDAVHDAAGASYVAIKPEVPAGTELTDENYWFLWADPNSQFADLSELVKTFNGRITQNTEDIATKAPNNHASEDATYGVGNAANYGHVRLATEDTTATSDANAGIAATPKFIKSAIDASKFIGATVVSFGDSITRGFGLTNPTTECWPARLCSTLGATLYNYAVDGANFSSGGIAKQVTTAGEDSKFKNVDVDLVLFGGGINDHGQDQNSIITGVTSAVSNAKTLFPNAKIYALPVLCASKPLDAIDQGDGQFLHSLSAQYVIDAFCQIENIRTFSRAFTWLQTSDIYANDNVHPNALGAEVIAYNVLSSIRGAEQDCKFVFKGLIYSDTIKDKIDASNSNSEFYTDGVTWTAYGKFQLTATDGIKTTDTLITLPNTCLGRRNQSRIIPLNNQSNDGILMYVNNAEIKFWNLDTSSKILKANTDYYWYITGMVGM